MSALILIGGLLVNFQDKKEYRTVGIIDFFHVVQIEFHLSKVAYPCIMVFSRLIHKS